MVELDVDRLDVGARDHDVVDRHVAKLQDGAQHCALVVGERRAGGFVGGDGVLDLGAGGAVLLQPERAEKRGSETPYDVGLLAPLRSAFVSRGGVGTSTLVVAHRPQAVA